MSSVQNTINRSGGTSIIVVANYSALPDPTTVSGQFYWCENSQGTAWLPGSLGGTYYSAGMYYSNGVSWSFIAVPYQATQDEVNTGTNTDKFVTPSTFANASKWLTKVNASRFIFQGKTSITGVTGETNICSFKIPAGAYASTDGFMFNMTKDKGTTASTITYTVYFGLTSGSRTSKLMQTAITGANTRADDNRRCWVNSNLLETAPPRNTNTQSGLSSFNNTDSPLTFNNSSDIWCTITANGQTISETVGILGAAITPM